MALKFDTSPTGLCKSHADWLYVTHRYVRQLEQGLSLLDEKFEESVQTDYEKIKIEHQDGVVEEVDYPTDHVDGIPETDFNLKGLFCQHFPNLTRCGSLITLWGEFEAWLISIADSLAEQQEIKPPNYKKRKSTGKGDKDKTPRIKVAFDFLIANGVSISEELRKIFKELDHIRKIRHACAHNRLHLDLQKNDNTRTYVKDSEHAELDTYDDEIILKPSFLAHFVSLQEEFVIQLGVALKEQE